MIYDINGKIQSDSIFILVLNATKIEPKHETKQVQKQSYKWDKRYFGRQAKIIAAELLICQSEEKSEGNRKYIEAEVPTPPATVT